MSYVSAWGKFISKDISCPYDRVVGFTSEKMYSLISVNTVDLKIILHTVYISILHAYLSVLNDDVGPKSAML